MMQLGEFELSLKVSDLAQSVAFYEKLGFRVSGGKFYEGWQTLEGSGLQIGLYQGHIKSNLLTFISAEVAGICEQLKASGMDIACGPEQEQDGTLGATLIDPDGNVIYLNTP